MGKKVISAIVLLFMLFAILPGVHTLAIEETELKSVKVSTAKGLKKALKDDSIGSITLSTKKSITLNITDIGNAASKKLVINAPNAVIVNHATFESIVIKNGHEYTEKASGNSIVVKDNSLDFIVDQNASVKELVSSGEKLNLLVEKKGVVDALVCNNEDGEVKLTIEKKAKVNIVNQTDAQIDIDGAGKKNAVIIEEKADATETEKAQSEKIEETQSQETPTTNNEENTEPIKDEKSKIKDIIMAWEYSDKVVWSTQLEQACKEFDDDDKIVRVGQNLNGSGWLQIDGAGENNYHRIVRVSNVDSQWVVDIWQYTSNLIYTKELISYDVDTMTKRYIDERVLYVDLDGNEKVDTATELFYDSNNNLTEARYSISGKNGGPDYAYRTDGEGVLGLETYTYYDENGNLSHGIIYYPLLDKVVTYDYNSRGKKINMKTTVGDINWDDFDDTIERGE